MLFNNPSGDLSQVVQFAQMISEFRDSYINLYNNMQFIRNNYDLRAIRANVSLLYSQLI
jgi:hypothetical protein